MSEWSPPSLSRGWTAAIGLLYLLYLAYALLVVRRLLFGLVTGLAVVFLYLLWRFLVAVEGIADALQRIAHQYEQTEQR